MSLLALITGLGADGPRTADALTGTPVMENFDDIRGRATKIRITLADETYSLSNTNGGWVMDGTSGYPVRPGRLAELSAGLEELVWDAPRTHDPLKLDHIGLGNPNEGGTGALIELFDENSERLSALITGRKGKFTYARDPDSNKAYRIKGNLPPLHNHDAWLDLDILDIKPDAVQALRIFDISGKELYLQRRVGSGERSFRPAPPYQNYRLVSRIAASTPALALSRFQPIGVKPSKDLKTKALTRHITQTHDGLEVNLLTYREPDGFYVTFRAIEAGEGAHRGSSINAKAEGWAFQISEYDWNDFTPRVSSIVRPPAPKTTP
ncbi:MAG: DUF4340 domain-containing protein [Hyphomonas sp.]